MTAVANEWPSDIQTRDNGNSQDQLDDLSHLPQWKRDFIEKKRALAAHQKLQQQRGTSKLQSNHHTNGFQKDLIDDEQRLETDSTSDSDSDSSDSNTHKSGGYSFVNGEQYNPDPMDDIRDSEKSEESTEDSSSEYNYKPGYVTKLLNKWSNISYQGVKADAEVRPRLAQQSLPSNIRTDIIQKKSESSVKTSSLSKTFNSSKSTSLSSTKPSLQRSNSQDQSYRDPEEIVLIENSHTDGTDYRPTYTAATPILKNEVTTDYEDKDSRYTSILSSLIINRPIEQRRRSIL